jgi:hypothetical protein
VAKRQEMPELPEEVFEQAKAAWVSAVRADDEDRTGVQALRPALAELHKFRNIVENAYNRLSLDARSKIDGLEEYEGVKINDPDWRRILYTKIDDLDFIIKRPRGDNQFTDTGLNLVGLRAFALILRDFWLSDSTRHWQSSGSGAVGKDQERLYSPAERFLYLHAHRVDPRATEDDARTVIKRPYSSK